jgi:hypothetical protein
VTNLGVSTVLARWAAKVEPRRPALRSRIGETLDSGNARADVFRVQREEPAAAATQLLSWRACQTRSVGNAGLSLPSGCYL